MPQRLLNWFAPAPHKPLLPEAEVARRYPKLRWQVFEAAFLAYATFYLVRNNLAPVAKEMGAALHYDKAMIGDILAGTAMAYGVGKLVMGFFSDRSDARKYVAVGLLVSALFNLAFGATTSYAGHVALWTLNGFVQGMGYGPCTRGLSHWYSASERGKIFGFWNISHNIGGGIAGYLAARCAEHGGWTSAFYVPAGISLLGAAYLFWRMRDTPQSEGLPPIQVYKRETESGAEQERELSAREVFLQTILPNKMLWVLAVANIFVYIARYAMVDWGPTYLKEVKGASLAQGGLSTLVIEFAGAAGMLCLGWLSDKLGGRRGRLSALAIIPLLIAFAAIRVTPQGMLWLDITLFAVVGFFVYTPVMFSGVMSLDLTNKKAVGTAAGFVGLFGYIGRVVQGKGLGWTAQHYGWNAALGAVLVCTFLALVLLAFLWNVRPRR
jgi:OPA family glycerol-3-phosphate transporter-like MFS transporter